MQPVEDFSRPGPRWRGKFSPQTLLFSVGQFLRLTRNSRCAAPGPFKPQGFSLREHRKPFSVSRASGRETQNSSDRKLWGVGVFPPIASYGASTPPQASGLQCQWACGYRATDKQEALDVSGAFSAHPARADSVWRAPGPFEHRASSASSRWKRRPTPGDHQLADYLRTSRPPTPRASS